MRQINPLYIVLLLCVVLFFVLFKLMQTKTQLHEVQSSFHKTKEMVHSIVELRDNWDNQKRTKNAISRILKSSMLSDTQILQKEKRGMIELHAYSMDAKSAGYLISRLLNETFLIKTMQIRRLSKDQLSLDVEIRL